MVPLEKLVEYGMRQLWGIGALSSKVGFAALILISGGRRYLSLSATRQLPFDKSLNPYKPLGASKGRLAPKILECPGGNLSGVVDLIYCS